MSKNKRSHGLLDGETHTSRLKRLYGDQLDKDTKALVDTELANQRLANKPDISLEVKSLKNEQNEQVSESALTAPHPLDDAPDPLSPVSRNGRRIASRQSRDKGVLIKFSSAEHDTIRRVAQWYGYSLAQTIRILAREREEVLWPNKSDRPNVFQLNMDEEKQREKVEKSSKQRQQRLLNAFQRKEMKLRKEAEWAKNQQEKLKSRENKALAGIKQMEEIRASKRAGTKKMNAQIHAQKLHERETYREEVLDVEVALAKERERLGRKLTESEKWAVGRRVRATVYEDTDKKVLNAILDAERKAKRKLSESEKWEIRKRVRPEIMKQMDK